MLLRDVIAEAAWHLDVGLPHPGAEEGSKGSVVRRLKGYVSWVQTGVSQVGPYLPTLITILKKIAASTKGPLLRNLLFC